MEKVRRRFERALEDTAWQARGYYMERVACERCAAVNAQTDTGFVIPVFAMAEMPRLEETLPQEGGVSAERSREMLNHRGGFWENEKGRNRYDRRPRRIFAACTAAALLLTVLALGYFFLFPVRSVTVVGNSYYSDRTLTELAGIERGMSIFRVDDRAVARRIASGNPFYMVTSIDKSLLTGGVTIYVIERTCDAYITYCGIDYLIDNRFRVLMTNTSANVELDYVRVEGLEISGCTLGKELTVYNDRQLPICQNILREIKAMGLGQWVRVLYMGDLNDITMITEDGYAVRIGESQRVHEKLRAMQLTCQWLKENGKTGGTVDVSNPEKPSWIPGIETEV